VIVSASGCAARGSKHVENDMSEPRKGKGPNLGLLLLIPAAVIIAKGASRRRARWGSAWGGTGGFGPRHGSYGHFGDSPIESAAIRVPPYVERMLDAWHAKAHEQVQTAESTTI
jgi:hypothetical protein